LILSFAEMFPVATLMFYSLLFSSVLAVIEPYPATNDEIPQNCTYGEETRYCWKDGLNILTDYTNISTAPEGKLVEVSSSIQ
jgi:hypothetical protein